MPIRAPCKWLIYMSSRGFLPSCAAGMRAELRGRCIASNIPLSEPLYNLDRLMRSVAVKLISKCVADCCRHRGAAGAARDVERQFRRSFLTCTFEG
jgi:hypothetical protein